jgi:site-specific recombinase XerD
MPKLSVVETPVPTAIATLVNDFLADRRSNGLSLRTIEAYEYPLTRQFLPFCAAEGVTDPGQLTAQLVGKFTTHLLEDGGRHGQLSRASVRSYVRSCRVFLAWAGKADGGATVVGASPKMPKPEKPIIEVLSRSEIQSMEDSAHTERDKLIIRVLADCGLRLGELLALRVNDILEPRRGEFFLKVRGKGSKERLVPLPAPLRRRLRTLGRGAEGQDRIFRSLRQGAGGEHHPLTSSGAEQCVRLAAREAGISRRVYPHLLRHSFATNWLRKDGNVVSLRNVLGHFDLSMIQGTYAHLDTSDDYRAAMRVLLGPE